MKGERRQCDTCHGLAIDGVADARDDPSTGIGPPQSPPPRGMPTMGMKRYRQHPVVSRLVMCSARARGVWLVLAMASCEDFPAAPASTVTVQAPAAAPWPQQLFNKDTALLAIDVQDKAGTAITGLQVQWQSSDPSVLEVRPIAPVGQRHEDSLVAELSVRIVAQRRGKATISATIAQPGIRPAGLSQEVLVMERWIAVSAGSSHSCGITIDHAAFCWGDGFLGNGSVVGSMIPTPVLTGLPFQSLVARDSFTCGLTLDGTGYCWGENQRSGRLGSGNLVSSLIPTPIASGTTFSSIVGGAAYACALSGTAGHCWGLDTEGQLGDAHLNFNFVPPRFDPPFDNCAGITGTIRCSMTPRQIRPPSDADAPILLRAVGPGEDHTCGILTTGRAICWGNHPRWGNLSLLASDSAILVPGSFVFDSVTSGVWHSCAIEHNTSRVRCWGYNTYGQLGTEVGVPVAGCDTAPCSLDPVTVAAQSVFRQVSAAGYTTCGLVDTGEVLCWGSDQFGQLGNDSSSLVTTCRGILCSKVPVRVQMPAGSVGVSISVGRSHACAIDDRGAAFCWGRGAGGELGSGDTLGSTIPVRVHEPNE
jgi:alpha-tubulin suppressor-like RCC1 family protein